MCIHFFGILVDWLSDTRGLFIFLGMIKVLPFCREKLVFKRYILKYLEVKCLDIYDLLSNNSEKVYSVKQLW